jgi:cell pole-organizing protein PopZ
MTRLDASNEPSMEDILASIRKIIAEEPPGSRPLPAPSPRPTPTPLQQAVFGRSAGSEPVADASNSGTATASEPYLRAMPAKGESKPFISTPFFAPRSEPSPVARVEPSFSPAVAPTEPAAPPVAEVEAPATESIPAARLSVEDQLSGLLDEVVSASSVSDGPPVSASIEKTKLEALDSSDFTGRKPLVSAPFIAPVEPAARTLDKPDKDLGRPNFTVSQDGYVPAANSGKEPVAAGAQSAAQGDPFNFDLGPSPFQAKANAEIAVAQQLPEKAAPEAVVEVPSVAEHISPQEAVFVLPSIAATIPPVSYGAVAPLVKSEAVVSESVAVADAEITPAVSISLPTATPSAAPIALTLASVPVAASPVVEPEHTSTSTSMTLTDIAAQRSMEDTVADLLRPMLKSWLSENMPKILERALRREISERLLSEHKTAAE